MDKDIQNINWIDQIELERTLNKTESIEAFSFLVKTYQMITRSPGL